MYNVDVRGTSCRLDYIVITEEAERLCDSLCYTRPRYFQGNPREPTDSRPEVMGDVK